MVKLLIAGSRGVVPTTEEFDSALAECELAPGDLDFLVSGGATGVDRAAEEWARSRGIPVERFEPNWKRFGNVAGLIRNAQMAEVADCAVVFWDGLSGGTANMIANMALSRKPMLVLKMTVKKSLIHLPSDFVQKG